MTLKKHIQEESKQRTPDSSSSADHHKNKNENATMAPHSSTRMRIRSVAARKRSMSRARSFSSFSALMTSDAVADLWSAAAPVTPEPQKRSKQGVPNAEEVPPNTESNTSNPAPEADTSATFELTSSLVPDAVLSFVRNCCMGASQQQPVCHKTETETKVTLSPVFAKEANALKQKVLEREEEEDAMQLLSVVPDEEQDICSIPNVSAAADNPNGLAYSQDLMETCLQAQDVAETEGIDTRLWDIEAVLNPDDLSSTNKPVPETTTPVETPVTESSPTEAPQSEMETSPPPLPPRAPSPRRRAISPRRLMRSLSVDRWDSRSSKSTSRSMSRDRGTRPSTPLVFAASGTSKMPENVIPPERHHRRKRSWIFGRRRTTADDNDPTCVEEARSDKENTVPPPTSTVTDEEEDSLSNSSLENEAEQEQKQEEEPANRPPESNHPQDEESCDSTSIHTGETTAATTAAKSLSFSYSADMMLEPDATANDNGKADLSSAPLESPHMLFSAPVGYDV